MSHSSIRLYATFVFLASTFFLSAGAPAQEDFAFELWPYRDGVEITGYKGNVGKTLTIPETIDGRPVRGIGYKAFKECDSLESVELPEGLETIDGYAFSGCVSLRNVYFPASLRTIESHAFCECRSLRKVTLPRNLQTIDKHAFGGCNSLAEIDFPKELKTIGDEAFWRCASLKRVVFPKGLRTIGDSAFFVCDSLVTVDFPEGLETIGSHAFWDCKSLRSVNFPRSLETIGYFAFDGCSFAEFTAPEGSRAAEWIREERPNSLKKGAARKGNSSSDTESNEDQAFLSQPFDDGVEIIGYKGPVGATLVVPKTIGGLPVRKIGYKAFQKTESLTLVKLPEGLQTIGTSAFRGCSALETVRLPGGLKTIEPCAFYDCDSLGNVDFPEGLQTIREFAFCSCAQLKSVELPESLKTIGYHAFARCDFDVVRLPSSLETIGGGWNCAAFELPEDNSRFRMLDGVLFDNETKTLLAYPGKKAGNDYVVPEGVETIGDAAFSGCKSLITVKLPQSLKTIGKNAFWDCESLAEIELPENLTSIRDWAFCCCVSLRKIAFPKRLKTIGNEAFSSCESLIDVELSEGLRKIGTGVFENCPSVEFTVPEGSWAAGWIMERRPNAIKKVLVPSSPAPGEGNSPADADNTALNEKQPFQTTPWKDGVEITGYEGSVGETLVIPGKIDGLPVRRIGSFAFSDCESLEDVELPDGLQAIGMNAFPDGVRLTAPEDLWTSEWIREEKEAKSSSDRRRDIFFTISLTALLILNIAFSTPWRRRFSNRDPMESQP